MRAIWERAPRTPGSSRKPSSLRQSTDGPLVSMQSNMNLLYREEEREMIPLCQADAALAASSIAAIAQLAPNDWGNSGFPGESRAE